MAPLNSLENEYPLIDSIFQTFCASNAIYSGSLPLTLFPIFFSNFSSNSIQCHHYSFFFSVEDFLLHDLDALFTSAANYSTSQRLEQGIHQLLSIVDALHPPLLNGLQLLEDSKRIKHVLPTGCEGIDAFLGGGLREGQLTELVGPSSSGKTQVCLMSASTVAKHKCSVIYLDTGNSFSPQRIAHFIGQSSDYVSGNQADRRLLQNVLDGIICYPVFDVYQMFDLLHQLKINLRSEIVKSDRHVQLLIVDSISSLITPILRGSGPQGHALMISVGFLLKQLAHEHNIAVLVTNHVVGGEDGNSKPALGESWKSVPHVRLLLSRESGGHVCNISIIKHPAMASGRTATSTRLFV